MGPRLSVVIPVFNVEPYIAECLKSVAEQDFTDFEVVIVDDGSTDASAFVAQKFATEDSRFRLVHQPNRGPGSARNAGLAHISPGTEYIAFVDGDDVVPRAAYSSLVASLDASGSEIAAGNVYRFSSLERYQFEKYARIFDQSRLRTSIFEVPGLLVDRTVWNKVYRRTFWNRHGISFPEGMLYEDSPVTVPLYYLAEAVDTVPEIVYYWRIREIGNPSITQRRTVSTMLDRFASIDLVRTFLKNQIDSPQDWLEPYDQNLLTEEIPLFFDELIEANHGYLHEFTTKAATLLKEISPELLVKLPEPLRHVYSAIRELRAHDLVDLMREIALDPEWRLRLAMSGTSASTAAGPHTNARSSVPPSPA